MWQACNTLTLRLRPTGDGRIRVGEMFSGIRTPLPSISAPSLAHWYCTFSWYCAIFFSLSQGKTSWPSTTNCLTIFNKCYGASGKKFATAASICSIGLIMEMNQYSYVSKPPSLCDRKQSQSPQRHFMLLSIFIDFAGIRSVAVCRSLPWLIYLANNVTWYQDQVAVQLALIGDAM